MGVDLKEHLRKQNKFLRLALISLIITIALLISLGYFTPPLPQTYTGTINIEPESERSKPYHSFHLKDKDSIHSYMILVKDQKFDKKIESFVGKRVKIKGHLFHNEPKDFDKVEIIEMAELQ